MTSDHRLQQALHRVLAREAGTNADAPAIAAAVRRACEQLARQLAPLIGDAGLAAICARSLHLVQRQDRRLAPVALPPGDDDPFMRVQLFLEHQEPGVAAATGVAVLATVGDVLAGFIGERLAIGLLRETWPDDFASDSAEETTA
jgi:hypothetical protein